MWQCATFLQRHLFQCPKNLPYLRGMKTVGIIAVCLLAGCVSAFAQSAGDTIKGVVSDSYGPMMMVNVVEMDSAGHILANGITDMNGCFRFVLVNPKDRLQITYVGYETVELPFDKDCFEIRMEEDKNSIILKFTPDTLFQGIPIPLDGDDPLGRAPSVQELPDK